ncbi:hypothetical protein R6Q57_026419 [Mikania cordata]
MNDGTKDVMDEGAKVPVEDAQDKNESRTLSWDAMEFYNNGDAPYCYSRILGLNNLHTDFWGVLLGYLNDGPLYAIAIEDRLLVQINLCTMELTQYWCNHKYSKHYGSLIHNGVLQKSDMFFDKLLDAVSYWRRVIHGPYKPQVKGYLKTGLINDDYLPKIGGALGKDSGVFLCMLMYKLVHKKTFTMEGGMEERCMKFRHVMADQFYKTRFFPNE